MANRRYRMGTFPSLRAAARYLAAVSGRPVATCHTALKRYQPGTTPRPPKASPCPRCAQIRRILNGQK